MMLTRRPLKIEKKIEWTGLQLYVERSAENLLLALLFLKIYEKETTLSSLAGGVDKKHTGNGFAYMFLQLHH